MTFLTNFIHTVKIKIQIEKNVELSDVCSVIFQRQKIKKLTF